MKSRIKEIRKKEGLSQQKFADKLGIARGNIAAYEVGKNAPSDAVVSLICSKFDINKDWLLTGNGEMCQHANSDDYSEISALIGEKDPKARQAIITYWNLSEDDKKLFWQFADKFLARTESDTKELLFPSPDNEKSIDEMVNDYRKQLELEKKAEEKSEASQKSG